MGKISFANMKLKMDTSVKEVEYEGNKIEILNYLSIEEKYDLIMITLQKSLENGIYNPLKLDMYFHLYLVYMYTNINFTDKQKEDEEKTYNILKSNGLIDLIVSKMNEEEYDELMDFMNDLIDAQMKYNISAAAVLNKLVDDLPKNAEAAMNIVNNFDKEKYQEVINFAQAANGNRAIE